MAVAQAQHVCRELMELIEEEGRRSEVRDPPCRRPHAGPPERDSPSRRRAYRRRAPDRRLVDANRILATADVAIVIGANDIVNPDAEEDKSSPLYGMPIFRPWTAKTVFVIKRGKGTGFSGVENPL